ncbi:MAG: hypothetical protein DYG98_08060 [Haliscomenobacteraceae bacterium CHB4]|nr:hypothetical protein [Haliscomenobacteraceae bacterium CHB4]
MRRLLSKTLSSDTSRYLDEEQAKIDGAPNFREQVTLAKSLWEHKNANVFREIREKLSELCPAPGICCYCESSHWRDIEHVSSKRVFPHKTFVWENYVPVCPRCNSDFKKHKTWVFNPAGSADTSDITPKRNVFDPPLSTDEVFINPRQETPQDLFFLQLLPQTFVFLPVSDDPNAREYKRTEFTCNEVLKLNREELRKSREAAAQDYLALIRAYRDVCAADNFDSLDIATLGIPAANRTQTFIGEKERIKYHIRSQFGQRRHPTVWSEMKRWRNNLPNFNELLMQFPEALTW